MARRPPPQPVHRNRGAVSSQTRHVAGVVVIPGTAPNPPVLFQLPPDIEDFVGRRQYLARLLDLLASRKDVEPTAVVVAAISGKVGIGKTALAIHLAHKLRPVFPDGQLYVNLTAPDGQPLNPADVLADILRTFGVEGAAIPDGIQLRTGLYRAQLATRRVLVVLDTATHEGQVRPFLPGDPNCAVLVTSRARLDGLEGARTFELDVLKPERAVELLGKVAGSERVAPEPAAAGRIVELCGYLPLAVRIAGAKLNARPYWSLTDLVRRLTDERGRLAQLKVGDLEIRSSFSLSYGDLPAEDRRAFRLLGLMGGRDFAVWASAALLDCGMDAAEDTLQRLADAQLLEVAGQIEPGPVRYRFHDLLRLFARERLEDEELPKDRLVALERLLNALIDQARDNNALLDPSGRHNLTGTEPGRSLAAAPQTGSHTLALGWFTAERTGLVTAVEQAHEAEFWDLAWQLAQTLVTFLDLRAHWKDWRRTHELALDAATRGGSLRGQAVTLRSIGRLHWEQNRWDDARRHFEKSLPILHRVDRTREAYTLVDLGQLHRYQGRAEHAIAALRQALEIFREQATATGEDTRHGEASALLRLSDVYRDQGRWDDATQYLERSVLEFGALGDRHARAYAQRSLGDLYRDLARWDDARRCYDDSLAVFRELGDQRWEARTLRSLGDLHRQQGRYEEAYECLQACLPMFSELGYDRWVARTLRSLGDLYRDQGRWNDALDTLEEALRQFEQLKERRWYARTLQSLGDLYRAQGYWNDALDNLQQALAILRELDDRRWVVETLLKLADVLQSQGDAEHAEEARQEARSILDALGMPVPGR
jgi:tetratricopeptide (TPR) repeat protein